MTLRRKAAVKRPRRWQCQYDGFLNEAGSRKCAGRCQSKRGKKASSWESEARKLHRQVVVPFPPRCFNCGLFSDKVQDAHIIGRGRNPNPAVKWHPLNGVPLCSGPGTNACHYKMDSSRIDPYQVAMNYLGLDRYNELMLAAQGRWDRDWPAVIQRLRNALERGRAA